MTYASGSTMSGTVESSPPQILLTTWKEDLMHAFHPADLLEPPAGVHHSNVLSLNLWSREYDAATIRSCALQ